MMGLPFPTRTAEVTQRRRFGCKWFAVRPASTRFAEAQEMFRQRFGRYAWAINITETCLLLGPLKEGEDAR